ncbi:MAG: hypothetical protein ABW040_10635 [Microbacteriaceae bacterium]
MADDRTAGPGTPDPDDVEPDSDDDALLWEGDEEFGRARDRRMLTSDADTSEEDSDAEDGLAADAAASAAPEAPRSAGRSGATVFFGALYLALTIGWVFSVQSAAASSGASFGAALVGGFGNFLALVAAPVWFAGVMHLTTFSALRYRVGWLALGSAILLPWPILLGVFFS